MDYFPLGLEGLLLLLITIRPILFLKSMDIYYREDIQHQRWVALNVGL